MSDDAMAQLINRIARGDRDAFAQLYRAMETPLYRFIQSRLNDPQRSSDISHDVFLQVWRDAAAFEGRSKVRTWIFAMAYRKVVDAYRRENRLIFGDEIPEVEDDAPTAEACMMAVQNKDAVRQCLETLNPHHRTAIELTFMEDMGYAEVAEITGVPEGTVKSRVFHAKQLLLRCLSARLGMKRDDG